MTCALREKLLYRMMDDEVAEHVARMVYIYIYIDALFILQRWEGEMKLDVKEVT
jgi:hypothetical protein